MSASRTPRRPDPATERLTGWIAPVVGAAGYDLEEVLSYAPQAGWASATSGSLADTLGQLHRLEAVPGIENVEVQMVGEVGRR